VELAPPRRGPLAQGWRQLAPVWSLPAALRAVRAAVVVPGLFLLSTKVIDNPQMAIFAAFGGFATLVLAGFGGTRRDKLVAHVGLAVAGSFLLIIGTAVNSTTWLAALVTFAVAFCVLFAGVTSANAASGATAVLLAYVLPAASPGTVSMIPDRLAGWWMASVAGTVAVLVLHARPPTDRLRDAAAYLAEVLAQHLGTALASPPAQKNAYSPMEAKHQLLSAYTEVPYRPTGLTVTDQAIAALVEALQWCATSVVQAVAEPGRTSVQRSDGRRLAASAEVLRLSAELIRGGRAEGIDAAVLNLDSLVPAVDSFDGDSESREDLHGAFHSRLVAAASHSVAVNALIAARRTDSLALSEDDRPWLGDAVSAGESMRNHPVIRTFESVVAGHTSLRSIWFLNSARSAVALAVAVAIADVTNVQHGFWVVLGALSVLRTNAASTGATALRALVGTVAGFAVGAAVLLAIGHHSSVLWAVLPMAVLVAAYAPGTAPFTIGQAAFTVTITVLYNLIAPVGWKVGELRVEDVAIGAAVSALAGMLFWPRGATRVVADDLADAFHSGGVYLVQATAWALGVRGDRPAAAALVAATTRLDDALRGLLSEQGTRRVSKENVWRLAGAALRLRLMASDLARLASPRREQDEAVRGVLTEAVRLAGEYDDLSVRLGHNPGTVAQELATLHLSQSDARTEDDQVTWVRLHLEHLADNLAEVVEPAQAVAERMSSPWWR
jgi:uncharacterized membrane protein YccC